MPAYRVVTVWTGTAGSPWYSTFYVDTTKVADAQAAITVVSGFLATVDNFVHNTVTWVTEALVALMPTPDTVTSYIGTTPASGAGSATGDQLSLATQGLVQWQTAGVVNNRRVQGRTYIPAPVEGNNNSLGRPDTPYQTGVRTPMALALPYLMIASKKANIFFPTTSVSVWSQWAVLRSRRD